MRLNDITIILRTLVLPQTINVETQSGKRH